MAALKRALIVGIDDYDTAPRLHGCVNDAIAIAKVLEYHDDGSKNYDSQLLLSSTGRITRATLRKAWESLLDFDGEVLFYFSGHGSPTRFGGFLVTQDGVDGDWGLRMNDLVDLSNNSRATQVFMILDCCFSGAIGNLSSGGSTENQAQLREGVTILAASRPTEMAMEVGGHGVFTTLLLAALRGGAADVRGNVSAASVYAYAEAALGAWDQRPLYKSHANQLTPLRRCDPPVPDSLLRELPTLFKNPESNFQLDPSYEYTRDESVPDHVEIFDKFKVLRNARLLITIEDPDLYWAAMHSTSARLTPLGQFYWKLAKEHRF
jgi:uncharacterized caspase-like protein